MECAFKKCTLTHNNYIQQNTFPDQQNKIKFYITFAPNMSNVNNRILFLTILQFLFQINLHSQNNNPFEIRSRLDSVSKVQTNVTNKASSEISTDYRSDSSLLPSTIDSSNVKFINPFDVDHIPLRKSSGIKSGKNNIQQEKTQPAQNQSNNFIFWLLLLLSALLAIVINVNLSTIKLIFRSLFNINLFKLLHREEGSFFSLSQFLLYLMFFVNTSIVVFLFLKTKNTVSIFTDWVYILAGISLFYILKHILIFILGNIFSVQKSTSLYNFSILSYHIFAGIILLPLNFIAAFAPVKLAAFCIYLSLIFLSVVILFKVVRGLVISLDFWNNNFFQFFIYLCVFEILPVLILVKFLLYQINL
jgi:hypothetical protein